MKDAFAVLGLEARPTVNLLELQERYLQQAAVLHPDKKGGDAQAFAELGVARVLLEDPAERLYHLIQLQGGSVGSSSVGEAAELMDLTSILLEAEQQISQLRRASTPLAKAAGIYSARACLTRLELAEQRIHLLLERLDGELQMVDHFWPNVSLAELACIATSLRFVRKKQQQISESLFQLRNI